MNGRHRMTTTAWAAVVLAVWLFLASAWLHALWRT